MLANSKFKAAAALKAAPGKSITYAAHNAQFVAPSCNPPPLFWERHCCYLPGKGVNMNILLVTPDRVDADLIRNVLDGANDVPFELRWVRTLSDGLEVLSNGEISVALISLALAEVDGIEAVDKLLRATTHIPTVVLGDMHEADFARHAMQRKTDDYLRRDHVDEHTLPRAIRNVFARKAIEDALIIERNRAQVTLNAIGDAVLSTDLSGNITYLNLVAEIMTGWSRASCRR